MKEEEEEEAGEKTGKWRRGEENNNSKMSRSKCSHNTHHILGSTCFTHINLSNSMRQCDLLHEPRAMLLGFVFPLSHLPALDLEQIMSFLTALFSLPLERDKLLIFVRIRWAQEITNTT